MIYLPCKIKLMMWKSMICPTVLSLCKTMPRCAHKVKNSGTVDDYDWYLHLHLISPTSDILHEGALPPLKYDIRVRRRSDVTILCEPNTIRLAGSLQCSRGPDHRHTVGATDDPSRLGRADEGLGARVTSQSMSAAGEYRSIVISKYQNIERSKY